MGTATVCAETIVGGFVRIDVRELSHAWRTCLQGDPGAGGFRAWIALREMVARRRGLSGGRSPTFGLEELAKLTGTTARTAGASVCRLVAAGLVTWSEDAIDFQEQVLNEDDLLSDTIGAGQGSVIVPRRMLRFLARGARPALIATALASLLRCLSRRRAGFGVRGRLASSWVARAFGVDLRRVKQARAELVALGWLSRETSAAWSTNRWGSAWTVNLAWTPPPRDDRHPPQARTGASLPPPCLDPDPLPEQLDPDPAGRGPAGASLGSEKKEPSPDLQDIRPADLVNTARTLELHRQAVASGRITSSERDRVRFVAAVEHARTVGKANPCGLLARIVGRGWWHLISQGDEDRAARRLREHRRPSPAPNSKHSMPSLLQIRSPYGAERPSQEPTVLAGLLSQLARSGITSS